MFVMIGKIAVSNWVTEAGCAVVVNLQFGQHADGGVLLPAYLMSAERLSKQYWLNIGLLGFALMMPMMVTSELRISV
jgi:hypothetical protein